ncbi:hypothetical protein BDP27DRAFT_1370617 [Rhodocollybia butyracea]|uniref:Uncharacterized protein n=1 Tax=Rhodocollybia butyracea TaxID=206335 RepID=A0A9P5TZ06_9AGAR|nr:hypothetical protein BDP27DRAFT_1370617 [Rhodocollybia butyracea]
MPKTEAQKASQKKWKQKAMREQQNKRANANYYCKLKATAPTDVTASQTLTYENIDLMQTQMPSVEFENSSYRHEFETTRYAKQEEYQALECHGNSEASLLRLPSTDHASSFSVQNHGDFKVIPGHHGGFGPASSRRPSVDYLRGWGAPNGFRSLNEPGQSGLSQNHGDLEPKSFSSHNKWMQSVDHRTSSSFNNYYAATSPDYIPSTQSISPVMNHNSSSFMTGDSPQPHFRMKHYYDPVRDIDDHPSDKIESMGFGSSSISHFVQSPKPTQSLPFQDVPVNISDGPMLDLASPLPIHAHTHVTLGEKLHLSTSRCTPSLSDPSTSHLETELDASLFVDPTETAPILSNVAEPILSTSTVPFILETESILPSLHLTSDCAVEFSSTYYSSRPHYYSDLVFEPTDFTAEILGLHMGEQAEIQVWPNGWKTILPELRHESHSGNILEADAKAVKWMANPANIAPPEQSIVRYLDAKSYSSPASLIKDIRSLMAKSFVVVLPNAVAPVGPRQLDTLEDITYVLGAGSSQAQAITYHDMELRARDPGQPTFLHDMKQPSKVHMLLDFPVAIETIPHPFHLLNDGKISVEQMNSDMLYRVRTSKWGLLHMAGTFTYPHIDTAGYAVGGQVTGDRNDPQPKIWAGLSLKDPSMAKLPMEKLAEKFQDVTSMIASSAEEYHQWLKGFKKAKNNAKKVPLFPTQGPDTWSEVWNVELIYLRPGDIFSHSYGYDTMHLTETARRIQHLSRGTVTNQEHIGTYETLEQMLLTLHGHTERVFYRRAIGALCLMILFPTQYFNREDQEVLDEASKIYKDIACEVAIFVAGHYLGIPRGEKKKFTEDVLVDYLYDGNTDYTDAGVSFTLGTLLTEETKKIFVQREKRAKKKKEPRAKK